MEHHQSDKNLIVTRGASPWAEGHLEKGSMPRSAVGAPSTSNMGCCGFPFAEKASEKVAMIAVPDVVISSTGG
jgi:hypothetical protein